MRFLAQGQLWRLVHDEKFEAGKKMRKRELEASMKRQEFFLGVLESWAKSNRWPWDLNLCQEPRSMGGASTQMDDHVPELRAPARQPDQGACHRFRIRDEQKI